jgi:hypothetical protein
MAATTADGIKIDEVVSQERKMIMLVTFHGEP